MGELNYSELVFIEFTLTYYCIHEIGEMRKNPDIYSDEEIKEFRLSVQELINKIQKLEKGE